MFGLSKKEKLTKISIAQELELESLRKLQSEVGDRIFDELEKAAAQNINFDPIKDSEYFKELYTLIIGRIPQNGDTRSFNYKITISVDDPTTHAKTCLNKNGDLVKGVAIYQIEIDMTKFGMELFMFKCPYGPDVCIWDFSVNHLEHFIEMARILTRGYRHSKLC